MKSPSLQFFLQRASVEDTEISAASKEGPAISPCHIPRSRWRVVDGRSLMRSPHQSRTPHPEPTKKTLELASRICVAQRFTKLSRSLTEGLRASWK